MCTNTTTSHNDNGHGKAETTEPQWKLHKVFCGTCYGAIVTGPESVHVRPEGGPNGPGVFLYGEVVPVLVEARESLAGQKELRAKILSPDQQWYWVNNPEKLLGFEGHYN